MLLQMITLMCSKIMESVDPTEVRLGEKRWLFQDFIAHFFKALNSIPLSTHIIVYVSMRLVTLVASKFWQS